MGSQSENQNQLIENTFKGFSQDMQLCIQTCTVSHQISLQTLAYCLKQEGEHLNPKHLKALMDCAQLCIVSAEFMSRDSKLHTAVCGVCADACLDCLESCEKFHDDETMKLCADVCRQCEKCCRKMEKEQLM